MSYRTPSPLPTHLRFAARTDVGPVRMLNEDGFLVADLAGGARLGPDACAGVLESDAGIALAAIDGMGGHSSGAPATELAVDAFHARLRAGVPAGDVAMEQLLVATMNDAARAIFTTGQRDRTKFGMGAVAVLGVVAGDRLHLVSAGDSRAYVLRAGRLAQVTRDDTLIEDARAHAFEHSFTEEDLENLPRNVVTKALGMAESIAVKATTLPLCAGDVLLFCSDGLHGEVDDEAIAGVLRALPDPAEACSALLHLAIKAGGRDNITVVVARCEGAFLRAPGAGDVIESRSTSLPSRSSSRNSAPRVSG